MLLGAGGGQRKYAVQAPERSQHLYINPALFLGGAFMHRV